MCSAEVLSFNNIDSAIVPVMNLSVLKFAKMWRRLRKNIYLWRAKSPILRGGMPYKIPKNV